MTEQDRALCEEHIAAMQKYIADLEGNTQPAMPGKEEALADEVGPPLTRIAKRAAFMADISTIRAALIASGGNVAAAAQALDLPRTSLDKRITRIGLRPWLAESYPALRRPQK